MSHMVIYRGPDGKPGYHQTDDIHDAVGFVEQLRNDQGVEHARIFRLEEVNFEYRPYFRVELTGAPSLDAGSSKPAVTAAPVAEKVVETKPAAVTETASKDESLSDSAAKVAAKADADVAPKVDSEVAAAADVADSATSTMTSSGTDNGVGARRGLFGR